MKTTLEIPDKIFRQAKAEAAIHGIPLREFVTVAVVEKLDTAKRNGQKAKDQKPWMKAFGKLSHLHEETERINRIIEEEFEQIDEPEDLL